LRRQGARFFSLIAQKPCTPITEKALQSKLLRDFSVIEQTLNKKHKIPLPAYAPDSGKMQG